VFVLVPPYSGCPGPKAVKQLYVRACVRACVCVCDTGLWSFLMAGSLPLKNDVQLVTQLPQSRRQVHDVLSAAESLPPISDSEVTCGPVTRLATLSSSAMSSSNSTDFSSSSKAKSHNLIHNPVKPHNGTLCRAMSYRETVPCHQFLPRNAMHPRY